MKSFLLTFLTMTIISYSLYAQPSSQHNLQSDHLASRWDEAIPLGNGMLGALIWQKDNTLRLSLDRADLWDERQAFQLQQHDFKWVQQKLDGGQYAEVQKWGDNPYGDNSYPTKLPAAALSFDLAALGKVVSNILDIKTATNTIRFDNGNIFTCFIHANKPIGYFEITGQHIEAALPKLLPHQYAMVSDHGREVSVVDGQSLSNLGYIQGKLTKSLRRQLIHQPTYENRFYEVLLEWKEVSPNKLIGMWTVSNNEKANLTKEIQSKTTSKFTETHLSWWHAYWKQSAVNIPDALLQRQYYLEMYKLGAAARKGAPAITLQAVWTADNGGLPPWKGDFHNDLNTQLSYWPSYTGNRLAEAETFTDWLWKIRPANLAYTKQYFGVEGLNIPGVLTLSGIPMGGWIQYALSPTVSAWTAQHFYWQWKYSMDKKFLKEKALPYILESATYLLNITEVRNGKRYLPLSSSPEYNDNSTNAWFKDWTNFDLALAHFLFEAAAEVCEASDLNDEANAWKIIRAQLPDYAKNETGLLVAADVPMEHSHRHMSPYLSIYPLGLLDINKAEDQDLITKSIRHLEKLGTRAWVGYSFSWMACLHARAKEADQAVLNLQKFANNFCSTNSFHVNGDQKGGQYSGFTYRPFTLEGNFAFAQGVHELLLQNKQGYVELFPAIPTNWRNISFTDLRAEGGFIISATITNGQLDNLTIKAEQTGTLRLRYEHALKVKSKKMIHKLGDIYTISLKSGEKIALEQI
ncbi:glycosyl hydrolase family 95 catalytic domain-containing protein [Sphingobacterium faecium]